MRRTQGHGGQQGHGCPWCGNGSRGGGGFWKWVVGAVVVYVLVQNFQSTDTGQTDYKPPAQTQTQEKCDPDALLQLGCTP